MKTNLFILLWVFILSCPTINFSQNLIPNASFETRENGIPTSAPNMEDQVEGSVKYWSSVNSPDWYGDDGGHFIGAYNNYPNYGNVSAHSGNYYIGFASCEGAQVQLTNNVEELKWVTISFWLSPRDRFDTQINAYLMKQQVDNNALSNCTAPAMGSDAIHFQMDINSMVGGNYIPGQWYYVQFEPQLIPVKQNSDDDDYEWLVIKGENIAGTFLSTEYVYIDDISLIQMDFCDNICAKSNGGVTATSIIPDVMIGNYGLNFFATFQNANELIFRVFNRWGCLIYESYNYDPNSLVDPGYTDFAIVWNGNKNISCSICCNTSDGDVIVPELYNITIDAESCTGADYHYTGDLTVGDIYSPPAVPYPATQNTETDCCPTNKIYQNYDFYSNSRTDVDNAITAGSNVTGGTTGPVVVHSNANVKFYAGNTINLEPGFSVELGAQFLAYIQPCGQTERMYLPRSLREQYENMRNEAKSDSLSARLFTRIKIAPNPNSGIFTITGLNGSDSRESTKIVITNIYGSIVYTAETIKASEVIDLSTLSKGIYFVKTEDSAKKVQVEKIVIE